MSYYQPGQPQYSQGQQPPPHGAYQQPGQYPQGQHPPPQQHQQHQQQQHHQQQWGGVPGGAPPVDPNVAQWFQAVDRDRTGHISAQELQAALTNSNWSKFDLGTCKLMVGMFDRDRSGQIDIGEFQALWNYIHQWKSIFDRFDGDKSGSIDHNELHNAFMQLGYRVSPEFSREAVLRHDSTGHQRINFDSFIHACVLIKQITDRFRAKDPSGSGQVQIGYEEYLAAVVLNRI